jgi:hypothetical protein
MHTVYSHNLETLNVLDIVCACTLFEGPSLSHCCDLVAYASVDLSASCILFVKEIPCSIHVITAS